MAKLLKWIVGIVLTLLVVLIILAVSIKMLVDPNDYKAEITQAVQDATGRTLSLNGDIKLSVFPWLGLQLNQASLSNAKGFGEQPFAAVEHTSVNVKLIPLLSKQIQVDQIELQGLRLNLQKNKAGVSNWDDLSGKSEADTDSKPASNEKTAAGSQSLSIGGIQIEDAQISWNDAESGKKASLSGFNLKTGAIEAGESIDVEMSLSVDSNQPPLKADLSLEARFSMSADGQSFKMQPFELHLENVKTANDISLDVLIIAALEANQTAQSVHLSGLDVSLKAQGKGLPKGEMLASLQADVMADMSRQTVKVSGLKLSAAELQLNGELDAKNLSGQPDVSGQLKLAAFNLSQWMQDMGMPAPATSDPGVLQQVAFSTRVASKGQQVGFEDLLLTVDDTHMKGFIRLADLKKQALRFDLSVDAINLDRYLPPASEKATGKPASTEQPSASQELPLEQLRSLDINGVFRLGQLTVNKLKVADVVITLKADKGQITLDTVANKLYQGNARVNVKMNVNGKQPRFNISKRVNNFQLGPMLTDLTGKDTLTGTAQMKADLTSMGSTPDSMKRALNGTLDFTFKNGAIKGINLAQMIRDAKASLGMGKASKSKEAPQTDFSEIIGHAKITQGVVNNDVLKIKSPYLRAGGQGTANLVSEQLDYKIKTTLVKSDTGQGGGDLKDLQGVPIPMHYKGSFEQISNFKNWSIDMQDVAVQKGKQELEKAISDKLLGKPGKDKKDSKSGDLGGLLKDKLKF